MKSILYSAVLALLLLNTGCMKTYFSDGTQSRLSPLPTPFQDKEVEVFFPGERPTDTAYVKVAILEQRIEGNAVAYGKLVDAVKLKAKEQGMDAVLLLDKNQSTRLQREGILSNMIAEIITGEEQEQEYYSVATHELAGIGIKYKKNLQYLPEFVKSKNIFLLKEGQETLLGSVPIDQEGVPGKPSITSLDDQQLYEQYVQRYDLNHLLNEKGPKWRYSDVQGRVLKRKLIAPKGGHVLKTVKITYNALLLPEKLDLRTSTELLPETVVPETVLLTYNDQRKLTEKKVLRNKELYAREVNTYGANGKLESVLHYTVQNGKEVPFLKTVYEYYQSLATAN